MKKIRCGFCSKLKDGVEGVENFFTNIKGATKQAICDECIIECAVKLSREDPVRFMSRLFEAILSEQERRTQETAADLEKGTTALGRLREIAKRLNLPSLISPSS